MARDVIGAPGEGLVGNILLVDDVPLNLRLLGKVLGRAGHQVRPALDGPRALEAARASVPDLVLLDVNMPGMGGFEVCAAFKQDPRLREVPIIFLSAADERPERSRAFEAGAVDYLVKPFDTDEVLARIQTHLALSAARQGQQALTSVVAQQIDEPLGRLIERLGEGGIEAGELLEFKLVIERVQAAARVVQARLRGG